MRPGSYSSPKFVNDITHPVTFIAFLLVLCIGGWITIRTWFFPS